MTDLLKLSKPELSISWRFVSFTQFLKHLNIIRHNQNRFLYYLSVYVKSFKELFLDSLGEVFFSKASAKLQTIFQPSKYFEEKV